MEKKAKTAFSIQEKIFSLTSPLDLLDLRREIIEKTQKQVDKLVPQLEKAEKQNDTNKILGLNSSIKHGTEIFKRNIKAVEMRIVELYPEADDIVKACSGINNSDKIGSICNIWAKAKAEQNEKKYSRFDLVFNKTK